MSDRPFKVLVIRFSSIGDIVLTSPVVRGLKHQLGAEVHFLTKRPFASIMEANPFVSRVFSIESKVAEVMPALQSEQYDAVVDLHRNLRSGQVKRGLSAKSYTFNKINAAKWLRVNLGMDWLPRKHIVERYLAAGSPLGLVADQEGLDYFIPEPEEVDLAKLAGEWSTKDAAYREDLRQGAYVGLVIGAAHATKRLPVDKLEELVRQLPKPVVLLGGPGDRETGRFIAEAVSGVLNTCGQFSLHGSASLLRQCAVVITHDTGLMHIGAAFGKKMIVVWGNTIPEFGMYPFLPEGQGVYHNFEVEGLKCRPCSKIGHSRCPKGHFNCMLRQPLSKIAYQAKALMEVG